MAIDPVQGLIDYVNEIKPFHTKILEVIIAYAQNDDTDVTITEDFALDVSLFYPAVADEDDVPIRNCPQGYGSIWDRQSPYIVVDANISPQTISLEGDHTDVFEVGMKFEIREPYTDHAAVYDSPATESTPRVTRMLTTSVSYDEDTSRTTLGVVQLDFDYLGSPVTGSPAVVAVDSNVFSFDPLLFESPLEGGNHSNANMADLWFTGEEYFGSPITADYVFAPTPYDNFDRTTAVRYPVVTHGGSPTTTIIDGKYYVEIEILDLESPSNSGWGPFFGFGRSELFRRDGRASSVPTDQAVWIDGFNTSTTSRILRGDGTYDTGSPLPRMAIGDVVRLAIDYQNEKVWFGINNKWVGSGTQDPSSNQGGYWPTDFTSPVGGRHNFSVRPRFTLMHWPYSQTGGGSPHLPGSRTNLEDVTAWRFSEQYWEYTAPTGFDEWPNLVSEPNTAGPGEYKWIYQNEPYDYDVGSSGTRAFVNTFNQRPVITFTPAPASSGTSSTFYSLPRSIADGGKFYIECICLTNNVSRSFGLVDRDEVFASLGSPIVPIGSPLSANIISKSQSILLTSSGQIVRNGSVFLPSQHSYASGTFWDGGPTDDGRTLGTEELQSGDTVMFAFDFDRNLMHVGLNGTWRLGIDPTTGLSGGSPEGGVEIAIGGSPLNHIYLFGMSTNSFCTIANLGGVEFEYEPPAGYLPWALSIAGSPNAGSPLTPEFGSPPFAGDEFWFPPYAEGSISNGDVFIIYDVVETKSLNIITRSSNQFGSPEPWGSPRVAFGSPRPGSPKFFPNGSPGVYPTFGSPTGVGNTIIIKAPSIAEFTYGKEVQIRNASEPTLNRDYNIYSALDLGGSPNLIQLTVLDPIHVNTTNDGELVLAPFGYSGGGFCSDVPPELSQLHFMEIYQPSWRLGDGNWVQEEIVGSPFWSPSEIFSGSEQGDLWVAADILSGSPTVSAQGTVARWVGRINGTELTQTDETRKPKLNVANNRGTYGQTYLSFDLTDVDDAEVYGDILIGNLAINTAELTMIAVIQNDDLVGSSGVGGDASRNARVVSLRRNSNQGEAHLQFNAGGHDVNDLIYGTAGYRHPQNVSVQIRGGSPLQDNLALLDRGVVSYIRDGNNFQRAWIDGTSYPIGSPEVENDATTAFTSQYLAIGGNPNSDGSLNVTGDSFWLGKVFSFLVIDRALSDEERIKAENYLLNISHAKELLKPGFQHFILAANSTNNTIEVQGDVRSLLSDSNFVGSPIGSPLVIQAVIQHSMNPGSPTTLNNNNGEVIISSITYNVSTNRSTLFLDTVTDDYPTGWIIPVVK